MKKIIIIFCLTFFSEFLSAQKDIDSIVVSRDTIHISGKVLNENGEAIFGASVLSESLDEKYNYIQAKTDKTGAFNLKGINPNDVLRIRHDGLATGFRIKGARYLLISLTPPGKRDLNNYGDVFSIKAQRVAIKPKYTYKAKDTTINLGRHPFGYDSPAAYPGGMQKFYDLIKNNLVYPKKAIENSIEGLVAVEFTIDRFGSYQDFVVTRDIGYGCAEELLRVVKQSKKWYPAMNGLFVDQRIVLEIPFKLTD